MNNPLESLVKAQVHEYQIAMELTPDEKQDVAPCLECGSKPHLTLKFFTNRKLTKKEEKVACVGALACVNKQHAVVSDTVSIRHMPFYSYKYICPNEDKHEE